MSKVRQAALSPAQIAKLSPDRFQPTPRTPLQNPGNPHLGYRRTTHRYPKEGAFFPTGPQRTPDAKAAGIAAANREADRLHREREQDRLVAEFVAGLTGHDRAFAENAGLAKPLADHVPARRLGELAPEEESSRDRFDAVTGEYGVQNGSHALQPSTHPIIDRLEPRAAVAVEDLTPGEVDEAHEAFGRGLGWVHEAQHLVKKGRRLAVFCALVCPDLACEVSARLPEEMREDLRRWLDADLVLLALVFRRVFVWCRQVADLAALGLSGDIIAYVIRPALLDAATNAQLGSEQNNTRQAVNKRLQDFRDTFAGIRARTMRGEDTRAACRAAQLAA